MLTSAVCDVEKYLSVFKQAADSEYAAMAAVMKGLSGVLSTSATVPPV